MHRIFWSETEYAGILKVVWSTNSLFQLSKDITEHIIELNSNGMDVIGGKDLPDDISPTEKLNIHINTYLTISSEGNLTVVTKPLSPQDIENQLAEEKRLADRTSGLSILRSLGMSDDELKALLG